MCLQNPSTNPLPPTLPLLRRRLHLRLSPPLSRTTSLPRPRRRITSPGEETAETTGISIALPTDVAITMTATRRRRETETGTGTGISSADVARALPTATSGILRHRGVRLRRTSGRVGGVLAAAMDLMIGKFCPVCVIVRIEFHLIDLL